MTRLEAGYVKPRLDWCDVNDLVQVTLKEIEKDLARHKVTVEIAPGLPLVRMDFVLTQQALANLLLNAATHTPPGTAVHLSAAAEDKPWSSPLPTPAPACPRMPSAASSTSSTAPRLPQPAAPVWGCRS